MVSAENLHHANPFAFELLHLLGYVSPILTRTLESDVQEQVVDVDIAWLGMPIKLHLVGRPVSLPDPDSPIVALAGDQVEALLIKVLFEIEYFVLWLDVGESSLLVGLLKHVEEVVEALLLLNREHLVKVVMVL